MKPELSYILAELFNKCLKESCFSVFKNVGETFTAKNYHPTGFPIVGGHGDCRFTDSW